MAQKIGLEVANGFIKVVSNDTEITYPNKVKQLTGIEFNVLGDLGVVYEYEGKQYILDNKGISSGGRSSKRYLTEDYLLEMLIAISQVITDRNVSLTIGVPCRDFENSTLKLPEKILILFAQFKTDLNPVPLLPISLPALGLLFP